MSSAGYCDDPGYIDNGYKDGTAPYTCASTVMYGCHSGFWLLGAAILKCSTAKAWNNGKPVCIDNSKKHINLF